MQANRNESAKGFTLLELLIVITIIAILSVALIIVINPAETLKKARDTQRISDLAALKTAIGIYTTTVSSPTLDKSNTFGGVGLTNGFCFSETGPNTTARISYSLANAPVTTNPAITFVNGTDKTTNSTFSQAITSGDGPYQYISSQSNAGLVNGNGWIPIDFTQITGGSPISNLPVDPTNTIAAPANPVSTDLVYRYACQDDAVSTKPSTVYEIDAQLESTYYTSTDNKKTKDGGDNDSYYETGTSLRLLPTGTNF